MRGRGVVTIFFVGLIAACGGGDGGVLERSTPPTAVSTAASTTSEPQSPTTAAAPTSPAEMVSPAAIDSTGLDTLSESLTADGLMPIDTALAIVAAVYAPLPGVTPAATPGDGGEIALATVTAHLRELSPEQAAAVDTIIGPFAIPLEAAVTAAGGPGGSRGGLRRQVVDHVAEAAQVMVEALDYFEPLVGETIDRSVISLRAVGYQNPDGTRNFSSPAEAAVTAWMEDGTCRIRINTDRAADAAMFRAQMAHETFHCLQYRHTDGAILPAWIMEGSAGWASEEFAAGTNQSRSWWNRWIIGPYLTLNTRSYDAIGIYSVLDAAGISPYPIIWQLLDAPTIPTLLAAMPGGVRDRWGTHHFNEPGWGAAWDVVGPGSNGDHPVIDTTHLTVDGGSIRPSAQPNAGEHRAAVMYVEAPGDVLFIDADGLSGGVRFDDGQTFMFGWSMSGRFCVKTGGCACPGGEPGPEPLTAVGSRNARIGMAEATGPGLFLEAKSLTTFCAGTVSETTTTLGSIDTCVVGTWSSTAYSLPPVPGQDGIVYTGGDGLLVSFIADGTFIIDYGASTPISGSWTGPDHGEPIVTTIRFSGSSSGSWGAGEAGFTATPADSGAIRIAASVTAAGQTTQLFDQSLTEFAAQIGGGGGAASAYTVARCDGGSLQLRTRYVGGEAGIDFNRVS